MYYAYLVLCTRPNGKQLSIFLFHLDDNSVKLTAISKSRNWKLNFVTFLMAKPIMTLNCVRLLDLFILLSVNVFSFHFWNINVLDNRVLIIFCKPEKLRILKPVHVHGIQRRAGPVKGSTPVLGSRGGEAFRNLRWGRQ